MDLPQENVVVLGVVVTSADGSNVGGANANVTTTVYICSSVHRVSEGSTEHSKTSGEMEAVEARLEMHFFICFFVDYRGIGPNSAPRHNYYICSPSR